MNFVDLLQSAKMGDEAATVELLRLYEPLLMKAAIVNDMFDEDLYQELRMVILQCIRTFPI